MKNMNQDDNKPVTVAVLKKELQITRDIFREEMQQLMQWTMDNFVTRTEFQDSMEKIDRRFTEIDGRFAKAAARFTRVETELAALKDAMNTNFRKLWGYMDKVMTEIDNNREERTFYSHQLLRLDDRSHDHEKRISKLEHNQV